MRADHLAELQQRVLGDTPVPRTLWDRAYLDLQNEPSEDDPRRGYFHLPPDLDPEEPADLFAMEVGLL
jgi:hypothetical protein